MKIRCCTELPADGRACDWERLGAAAAGRALACAAPGRLLQAVVFAGSPDPPSAHVARLSPAQLRPLRQSWWCLVRMSSGQLYNATLTGLCRSWSEHHGRRLESSSRVTATRVSAPPGRDEGARAAPVGSERREPLRPSSCRCLLSPTEGTLAFRGLKPALQISAEQTAVGTPLPRVQSASVSRLCAGRELTFPSATHREHCHFISFLW